MTVPGGSALNYPPNSQPSLNRVSKGRAPTVNDYRNFREGDEWLDNSSQDWYKLANITGTVATWVLIGGTGGAAETLTGDSGGPVPPDANNNINVLGTGSIVTTGDPGTNTLTIGDSGDVATTYTEDTGTATPSSNNLNVLGTGGITTSGAGSTVTIDGSGLRCLPWSVITDATYSLVTGAGVFANRGGGVTFTLPSTAMVGDCFQVVAMNADGFVVDYGTGQSIQVGSTTSTTTSGSLTSTGIGDWIEIVCNVEDTSFFANIKQGAITVT